MQINAALTDNEIRVRERKEIPKDFTFNKVGFTSAKDSDQIEKLWNSIPYWAFESYDIVRRLDNCIELNGIGASKGNALMDLSQRLKIRDRKSTRLNSSHVSISYAVFCLKKKTTI